MCAQLHESFLAFRETHEVLKAFNLDAELLAGIHRELIDHNLTEEAVVDVSLPCGLQPPVADATAEVAIGDASARVQQQADRNDEDGHEEVEHSCVNVPEQTDEPLVHPFVAVRRAWPTLHIYDLLFTIYLRFSYLAILHFSLFHFFTFSLFHF